MSEQEIRNITAAEARQRDRFDRKSVAVAEKMLRRMREMTHQPAALEPFLDTLSRIFVDREDARKPQNTPTVGTYCVMVPPEMIYAQGAMPVKLCGGSYTAFSIGDDISPRDACPLVKAVMGFEEIDAMPVYQNCSLMAVPVTCDCKKKLAGWLSARRPTAVLHVPANRERDEDMERFVGELYAFSRQLEGITGPPLSYENLSVAFRLTANAQYQLSRFIDLRRKHPRIIRGTFAMAAMNAMSYTWAPEWTAQMTALNDELRKCRQTW